MDELQAGDPRQAGGYTLLARLGSGGMGQVYYGRSPGGRHVAVKVIRADLARDQSFRLRFAREVAAARRVSGAFTAPVIDADPDAPVPWLVTGYVNGPSLAEVVGRHGPLPLSSVLTLAAGLAEGLAAVHAAGVIHRDLKPGNVLLAEDGPRLIDFGISQAADFAQITLTGFAVGTPGFMSPEQITGEPLGPASDIFALGAVLAFAATGEQPFGTGSAEERNKRVLQLVPNLDHVPGGLRMLVEPCMAREPAARPTATEFLADLVAAHPEAANQDNWLPEGILSQGGRRWSQAPSTGLVPHGAGVSPSRAVTVLPGMRTPRPGTRSRRTWAAGLTAAVAVIGAITFGLVALSGNPATKATPLVPASPAAVSPATLSPVTLSATAAVGFDWVGMTDFKEVFSSNSSFKQVGATWTEPWKVNTDCALKPCGAALTGTVDGSTPFTATLSRHGLTYTGDVAIDNDWTCGNEPVSSKLYVTLTGNGTAGPGGPSVTSFTGTLRWVVFNVGDCLGSTEYDMQVQSA